MESYKVGDWLIKSDDKSLWKVTSRVFDDCSDTYIFKLQSKDGQSFTNTLKNINYLGFVKYSFGEASALGLTVLEVEKTTAKCNHSNKYVNYATTQPYWFCPDCSTDLGDT